MAESRTTAVGGVSSRQGRFEGKPEPSRALHRFAVLTAAATFCLIIAGALVVGNGAGLAVPDWPLSFGMYMPPMVGGVFYEHGHRMIAGTVGVLMTVLAVWIWRVEPRSWVRWTALLGVVAVVLQAVLGGLTVLYRLPAPIVIFHACLAQLFFCITLSLAVFTSSGWNPQSPRIEGARSAGFRPLSAATSAALFLQLVLGAALRHRVLDVVPHVIGALTVSLLAGWTVLSAMNHLSELKPLQRLAGTLGVLLIVQLVLGGASYLSRGIQSAAHVPDPVMIWTTTAHVATGAAVLGTSWVLTLFSFRRLAPSVSESFEHAAQKSTA